VKFLIFGNVAALPGRQFAATGHSVSCLSFHFALLFLFRHIAGEFGAQGDEKWAEVMWRETKVEGSENGHSNSLSPVLSLFRLFRAGQGPGEYGEEKQTKKKTLKS
jgi:hypothetical protein